MAMLIAALAADGTSEIGNVAQIDRGYERIDLRLRDLAPASSGSALSRSRPSRSTPRGGLASGRTLPAGEAHEPYPAAPM